MVDCEATQECNEERTRRRQSSFPLRLADGLVLLVRSPLKSRGSHDDRQSHRRVVITSNADTL